MWYVCIELLEHWSIINKLSGLHIWNRSNDIVTSRTSIALMLLPKGWRSSCVHSATWALWESCAYQSYKNHSGVMKRSTWISIPQPTKRIGGSDCKTLRHTSIFCHTSPVSGVFRYSAGTLTGVRGLQKLAYWVVNPFARLWRLLYARESFSYLPSGPETNEGVVKDKPRTPGQRPGMLFTESAVSGVSGSFRRNSISI